MQNSKLSKTHVVQLSKCELKRASTASRDCYYSATPPQSKHLATTTTSTCIASYLQHQSQAWRTSVPWSSWRSWQCWSPRGWHRRRSRCSRQIPGLSRSSCSSVPWLCRWCTPRLRTPPQTWNSHALMSISGCCAGFHTQWETCNTYIPLSVPSLCRRCTSHINREPATPLHTHVLLHHR